MSTTVEGDCWMCMEGPVNFQPCDCRGTISYIHPHCLEKWLESKTSRQELGPKEPFVCFICGTIYRKWKGNAPNTVAKWLPYDFARFLAVLLVAIAAAVYCSPVHIETFLQTSSETAPPTLSISPAADFAVVDNVEIVDSCRLRPLLWKAVPGWMLWELIELQLVCESGQGSANYDLYGREQKCPEWWDKELLAFHPLSNEERSDAIHVCQIAALPSVVHLHSLPFLRKNVPVSVQIRETQQQYKVNEDDLLGDCNRLKPPISFEGENSEWLSRAFLTVAMRNGKDRSHRTLEFQATLCTKEPVEAKLNVPEIRLQFANKHAYVVQADLLPDHTDPFEEGELFRTSTRWKMYFCISFDVRRDPLFFWQQFPIDFHLVVRDDQRGVHSLDIRLSPEFSRALIEIKR